MTLSLSCCWRGRNEFTIDDYEFGVKTEPADLPTVRTSQHTLKVRTPARVFFTLLNPQNTVLVFISNHLKLIRAITIVLGVQNTAVLLQ